MALKAKNREGGGGGEDPNEHAVSAAADSSSSWIWALCLPLWLVYVSNQWSRTSIYYLVDFSSAAEAFKAMNVDIGFDEAQYGILASVAFTLLFAVASLGAGIASDRTDRKLLTVASAAMWSVATFATANSHSYPEVLAFRVLMGLACAFSTPTAYTLLQERVPTERQSLASSLYGTGVNVASGLASLSILLDNQFGWRRALEIIAGFGVASTVVSAVLLPSDEKRKTATPSSVANEEQLQSDGGDEEGGGMSEILSDVSSIVSTSRVRWIFLASFLRFCSGLCIGVWSAPFYRMTFAGNESSYSLYQALISLVGASSSGLLGGTIADWLASTAKTSETNDDDADAIGRKLWVPVVGSLLAAPTWFFAVKTNQPFETAMLWLAAEYFVAECWFGPTISTLQATVPPRTGGTAQGLFTLTGAIANFAPTIVGYVYGQANAAAEGTGGSSTELSMLLSAAVCFGYISSAICFAFAAQSPPPPVSASGGKQLKEA